MSSRNSVRAMPQGVGNFWHPCPELLTWGSGFLTLPNASGSAETARKRVRCSPIASVKASFSLMARHAVPAPKTPIKPAHLAYRSGVLVSGWRTSVGHGHDRGQSDLRNRRYHRCPRIRACPWGTPDVQKRICAPCRSAQVMLLRARNGERVRGDSTPPWAPNTRSPYMGRTLPGQNPSAPVGTLRQQRE